MSIYYFSEKIKFNLRKKKEISTWLQRVIYQEGYKLHHINFIFCSDQFLYKKNKTYLNHDTLTDVITFNYAAQSKTIWGDIYISINRVRENAKSYKRKFLEELYTVMVHGTLHLLFYGDHTEEDKKIMQEKEFFYLSQLLPTPPPLLTQIKQ